MKAMNSPASTSRVQSLEHADLLAAAHVALAEARAPRIRSLAVPVAVGSHHEHALAHAVPGRRRGRFATLYDSLLCPFPGNR